MNGLDDDATVLSSPPSFDEDCSAVIISVARCNAAFFVRLFVAGDDADNDDDDDVAVKASAPCPDNAVVAATIETTIPGIFMAVRV